MRDASGDIRVLSVIQPFRPAFSGEGEWWLRTIPFLRSLGVEVEILTGGAQNGGPEVVEGVVVHRIPTPDGSPSLAGHVRRVLRALQALRVRRRRFDVALFHSPNNDAAFASCVAGRLCGWKTVYKATLLGSDDLETLATSGRMGPLRVAALRLAHGVIAPSRPMVRPHEERRWLRGRLLVVPQGVDLERFRPADAARRGAARRELGLADDARVVLFCGAVIQRKGVDLLVEAWHRVSRQVPEAVLLMVGPHHRSGLREPEYRSFSEGIVRRIEELGLAERIRLLGYQREMDRFYAAADVFAFPSRFEGWPAALAEALASGLPCVVSELRGISEEHLEDGVQGFIVRSEDPLAYAERLARLLVDADAARRMGASARRRAVGRFDVGRVAGRYADFLRGVAVGRSDVAGRAES
jgi:glycosyltransferase involved in cell wall biosynthesis